MSKKNIVTEDEDFRYLEENFEEMMKEMEKELPEGIPHVFISSVAQFGLTELKDILWNELNKETFHEAEKIVHKNIDVSTLQFDDDDDFTYEEEEDDDEDYVEYEDWDDEEYDEEDADDDPSTEK